MLPEKQFNAIYKEYSDQIWRFCAMRTNDPDLAEDMTQQVFTKAWQSETFALPDTSHRAFLYQIARNLLVDHWRKKGKTISLDAPVGDGEQTLAEMIEDTISKSPEEQAATKESIRGVANKLRELPDRLQNVLIMRFVNQLSVKETATALGLTEGNVRQLQHRALKALRKELKTTPKK